MLVKELLPNSFGIQKVFKGFIMYFQSKKQPQARSSRQAYEPEDHPRL